MLSLRSRIFHSHHSHFSSDHSAPVGTLRPPQYKNWSEDSLLQAYNAVKAKRMTVRRAAEAYHVPRSTLGDRLSGRTHFGGHSGPSRYLSDIEEASFLRNATSMGFARTKKEVLAMVEEIVCLKGREVQVSKGRWESFKRRHPSITLRCAEKISYARLIATDPTIISCYFDLLHQTLEAYELFDCPSQIFNCNESGMPLEHKPPSVVAIKGQKHPRTVTAGTKKNISIMACCNASGNFIPPLVIFRRKALNSSLVKEEVPGTMYGLSDLARMDGY